LSTSEPLRPVASGERIATLDILRGFALFGILLVNMAFFSSPVPVAAGMVEWWRGTADRIAHAFLVFATHGKFYSLFSFLFGVGFSIQLARAESRGASGARFFAKRLLVLLAIGAVHAFLIWMGDILMLYALLGFLLILFRNRQPKTLLIWAVVLFAIPVLFMGGLTALVAVGRAFEPAEMQKEFAQQAMEFERQVQSALQVYTQGTFADMTAQRAREVAFFYSWAPVMFAPNVLALFLLGLYAGRRGILQDIPAHLPFIRRTLRWGLLLGLVGNAVFTWATLAGNPAVPSAVTAIGMAAFSFGAPALAFLYASALTLAAQQPAWQRRLAPVAAMGRMALTNYLLQSLLCTTIFYAFGLGLYGRVGPAAGIALTAAVYLLQLPLSVWWLKRFQMGPVEWAWRSLTYGQSQPLLLASPGRH
jgi:uncharacterized protein